MVRFQASSDAEKMEWVEKLGNAILMGLNMAPEEKPGKRVKAEVRETQKQVKVWVGEML